MRCNRCVLLTYFKLCIRSPAAAGAIFLRDEGKLNIDGDMTLADNTAFLDGGETQFIPGYIQYETIRSSTAKQYCP